MSDESLERVKRTQAMNQKLEEAGIHVKVSRDIEDLGNFSITPPTPVKKPGRPKQFYAIATKTLKDDNKALVYVVLYGDKTLAEFTNIGEAAEFIRTQTPAGKKLKNKVNALRRKAIDMINTAKALLRDAAFIEHGLRAVAIPQAQLSKEEINTPTSEPSPEVMLNANTDTVHAESKPRKVTAKVKKVGSKT